RAVRVRHGDHSLDRIDRAEGVGGVADGDDARARREQLLVLFENQIAGVVDRDDAQRRALRVAEELPRDDVRVVFDRGDQHLVALAHVRTAPRTDHQVDGLGGAAGEDDLLLVARVQGELDRGARRLVRRGGDLGEVVHAAVYVRV